MRDFFRSFKFKVFAVIALILIGLMIRTATNGGLASFTADAASTIAYPFQKLSAGISGFFTGLADDFHTFTSSKSEIAKLKKQVSDLQGKIVNYNDMLQENQQLEAAFDLHKDNPDFKMKPATVISHEPGKWFSSITIDKGSLAGIKYQDPVITEDGDLVGEVTQVSAYSSVVTTTLDPSIKVGVLVSETGENGQAHGDLSRINKSQFSVVMLPKDSAVSPGDIIITSGMAGVLPKNLKVGTVSSVGSDSTGMSVNAVCSPMVDPASLKKVMVLTDFNGKQSTTSSGSSSGGK